MDSQITSTQEFTRVSFLSTTSMFGILMPQAVEAPKKPPDDEDYKDILRATARHYSLAIADLKGGRRFRHIVRPRHVAMHLLREQGLSFPFIGKLLGGLDHTTVMSGCRVIEALLTKDEKVRRDLDAIRETL